MKLRSGSNEQPLPPNQAMQLTQHFVKVLEVAAFVFKVLGSSSCSR